MMTKKITQLLTVAASTIAFLFLNAVFAYASEGTVELRSTIGQESRCLATSVLMTDFNYSVIVSCRGLTYPPAVDMFSYVLWAIAIKDGKPVKLGEVGVGKVEFRTPAAFSNLFITKELNNTVKSPSEATVMQGNVQPIGFLEEPTAPTSAIEKPSPTLTPKIATQTEELASRIRRTFLTLFIALFALGAVAFALISTIRRLRE